MMEKEKTEVKDEYVEVVRDLERKADILREVHSDKAKRYRKHLDYIVYSTVALSAVITFLAIADPRILFLGDDVKGLFSSIVAVLGIVVLLLSISDRMLELNRKLCSHDETVKLLTEFIRRCHQCRHVDMQGCEECIKQEKVKNIRESYAFITRMALPTDQSDEEFVLSKKKLLIKIDLSKKLDKDPYADISKGLEELRKLE